MTSERAKEISKFLSLVLRHQPEKIGLTLDPAGWVEIETLLGALAQHGQPMTRIELEHVVATSDKQRFAISGDGQSIRANQGHSIKIDLGYTPAVPPACLFHGTSDRNLGSIREQGLLKGQRQHVHLSTTRATAHQVGQRHGRPVVLTIQSGVMHKAGHAFFISANGVWLTDAVPAEFIDFESELS